MGLFDSVGGTPYPIFLCYFFFSGDVIRIFFLCFFLSFRRLIFVVCFGKSLEKVRRVQEETRRFTSFC